MDSWKRRGAVEILRRVPDMYYGDELFDYHFHWIQSHLRYLTWRAGLAARRRARSDSLPCH